ncbi:hypothetical protein M378DRAFT_166683 [Amanita muscaria Koide BX008]|uniref:Uncharacterized protein n=1 Tax=Amanita muscaria (strain Koide BX008) TaxID=946122 RepID=A0A0C2T4V9_AMAMK|nr:hypothetical protein M378DRAFT_166683 [Amanita muscaria Koide BX008]
MPREDVKSQLDKRTKDFLENLKLPCVRGRPSVLLHKLGDFIEEPDSELQQKVNGVFRPDAPRHTIFINTSGSGKTRLLLEGLCQHWGLYFTSHVDSSSLGSVDLERAIQSMTSCSDGMFRPVLPPDTSPDFRTLLASNEELAGRVFKRMFLARLLIFHLFIEAMKASTSSDNSFTEDNVRDYRRKWLHFQLQPLFFNKISDPFHDLTHKLSAYLDSELQELTEEVLRHIRSALSSCTTSTSSSGSIPLYCIIDESQFAAKEYTDAFRSKDMERRPVLRPLVQTFRTLTSSLDVIILAGTGLSQSDVHDTMTSGTMKESTYRQCYDTGAFDGWEGKNGMSSWVKMFVPDWILEGPNGKRLEERMGYWLKGRHRFVAGYVTELLRHRYRQPIQLLDMYISQAIEPESREGVEKKKQVKLDDIELEPRDTFNFKKLKKYEDKLEKFRDIIPLYVMRSIFPGPFGDDEQLWIEYGLGRLRKEQGAARVVFDEPLVVAAANRWLNAESDRSYAYFARNIGSNENRGSSNGFENYIVYCLHLIFGVEKGRKLKQVFTFHDRIPRWAKKKRAKLVSVYVSSTGSLHVDPVKHAQFNGPSATLGTYTETAEETLAWLGHDSRTPFCFPCCNMGPDVIFVLELTNKKLIWVALQVKYSKSNGNKSLDKSTLEHAVRTVTPQHFFRDKNGAEFSPESRKNINQDTRKLLGELPDRCDDAGECSLLRVVASFPARPEFAKRDHWKGDKHPIASLNMEFVKQVTKNLSPLNILKNHERDWSPSSKRMRDSEVDNIVGKRRKTTVEEESDASESSSVKSAGSQKRERDADDSESGDGREKKRKTLDVWDTKQELDEKPIRENKMKILNVQTKKPEFKGALRRKSEKPIIPSAAMVGKTKGRRQRFRK